MPDGIPNVIHNCLEEYGIEDKCWPLTNYELAKAAEVLGVLDVADKYIDKNLQREFANHLDDVIAIQAKNTAAKYRELKRQKP